MKTSFEMGQLKGEAEVHWSKNEVTVVRGDRTQTYTYRRTPWGIQLMQNGRTYEGSLDFSKDNESLVTIDGQTFSIRWKDDRTGSSTSSTDAVDKIKATMPGRVVQIPVSVGADVIAGDPIIVLEAMKMENELKSPGNCRIKEIFCNVGDSVEMGTVLVQLEPLTEEDA